MLFIQNAKVLLYPLCLFSLVCFCLFVMCVVMLLVFVVFYSVYFALIGSFASTVLLYTMSL